MELPPDHPRTTTRRRSKPPFRRSRTSDIGRRWIALKSRDREMVVARVEAQWSLAEIAQRFGMRTVDAARMAVSRALKRLSAQMKPDA